MEYSDDILNLYSEVFSKQRRHFDVIKWDIFKSNKKITDAYLPNPKWQGDDTCKLADFSDASHRCAYLHKYAMLHTGLLCAVLEEALKMYSVYQALNSKLHLNLCSLGSGPGTDIVSLLLVLQERFGPVPCRATLVDYYAQWKGVFDAIVSELRTSTKFAHVKKIVSSQNFRYVYVGADLLRFDDRNLKVCAGIGDADIITMVKFISAAACKDTQYMVQNIFDLMKPGALLLFVDNDAGGFHEVLTYVAATSGMKSVFGPRKHIEFEEPLFDRVYEQHLHGQYKTRVRAEMWMKTTESRLLRPLNTTGQLRQEYYRKTYVNQSFPTAQMGSYDETDRGNFRLTRENSTSSENDKSCCRVM